MKTGTHGLVSLLALAANHPNSNGPLSTLEMIWNKQTKKKTEVTSFLNTNTVTVTAIFKVKKNQMTVCQKLNILNKHIQYSPVKLKSIKNT